MNSLSIGGFDYSKSDKFVGLCQMKYDIEHPDFLKMLKSGMLVTDLYDLLSSPTACERLSYYKDKCGLNITSANIYPLFERKLTEEQIKLYSFLQNNGCDFVDSLDVLDAFLKSGSDFGVLKKLYDKLNDNRLFLIVVLLGIYVRPIVEEDLEKLFLMSDEFSDELIEELYSDLLGGNMNDIVKNLCNTYQKVFVHIEEIHRKIVEGEEYLNLGDNELMEVEDVSIKYGDSYIEDPTALRLKILDVNINLKKRLEYFNLLGNLINIFGLNSLNQSLESGSDQKFNSKTFLDISLFLESINIGPEFSNKVLDDISSVLSSNNDSCDPVKFLESKKNLLLEYKKKGLDVDGNNLVAFASFRELNDDEISKLVEFQKGGIVVRKLDDIQILLNRKDFLLEYIKKGLNVGRNNVVAFASFRKLNDDEISKLVEFQRWGITVRNSDDIQILISCGEVSYETVEKLCDKGFDIVYPILDLVGELGLNDEEYNKFCLFAELMGVDFSDSDKLYENFLNLIKDKFSSKNLLGDILKMDSKFLQQLVDLFGTIKFEALECLLSVKDCLCDDVFNTLLDLKRMGKLKDGIWKMVESIDNKINLYNYNINLISDKQAELKRNNDQNVELKKKLEVFIHSLEDENETFDKFFHDCDILRIIKDFSKEFFVD